MAVEADTIAYIRILIGDSPVDITQRIFTNSEIAMFLRIEGGNAKRAAANMLDAIAVNEVLLSKVIRTQDLSTDGSKVADALRKQARVLREQADSEDGDQSYGFIVVQMGAPLTIPELAMENPWVGS